MPVGGDAPPAREHGQDAEDRQRIGGEHRTGARRGDDQAAECGADRARDVDAERIERDRLLQRGPRYELGNDRLKGGSGEGRAHRDGGGEGEQYPRVGQARERQHRQDRGAGQAEQLCAHQQLAPVDDVGERPGGEREDEHREGRRRLHQRDHQRVGRERGHQPARADIVHPGADVRDDGRDPQRAEHRVRKRTRGRRGGIGHALRVRRIAASISPPISPTCSRKVLRS